MEGVHPVALDEPEEDFPIFKTAFSSWTYAAQFHVPDYCRWLASHGLGDAYAFHHRLMQHYTWRRRQARPKRRGQWLFKMPFHLMELQTLIETYPDALFIQTHRAPAEVMGSWNSLVERARSVVMRPNSGDNTGAEQLAFMSGMLNGATRFRSAHPELEHRWIDVAYVDLIRGPMKVVRDIYCRFGLASGADGRQRNGRMALVAGRFATPGETAQLPVAGLRPHDGRGQCCVYTVSRFCCGTGDSHGRS